MTDQLGQQALTQRYDLLSRMLHWVFAVLIIYTIIGGISLHFIGNQSVWKFVSTLNMSLATCLIVLFPVRYVWSFFRREPDKVASVNRIQLAAAHFIHSLIYMLIAFVLFSGFVMVPDGYHLFWILYIPTPFESGQLTDHWFMLHKIGCYALAGLLALHICAALKHHFISRNGVLKRML
ncbi:cytochrome b [Burkholderia pseudomallei]|uniref:cytochrome b n=1 Tax=Burkholderia pseudomallei TaxID=28450 RepID=UPI000A19FDA7|nr:cytochrome b/b6 domain-containing protein [Burkholderia pseudomallei]ARL38883.1 cytochrome B [Burkholderia pseudomallei]